MKELMTKPFKGTVPAPWAPVVVNGQPGIGKSTLVMLMAATFGARISYWTATEPGAVFDPSVDWTEVDALVIDEINSWEPKSLRRELPDLLAQSEVARKGVILIGQSVATSSIADLLPADCLRLTPNFGMLRAA